MQKETMQKSPQASPVQRIGAGGAGTPAGFDNVHELHASLASSMEVTRKSIDGLKKFSEQQELNFKDSSQAHKLAQDELAILRKELGTLTCERNKAQQDLKTTVSSLEVTRKTMDGLKKLCEQQELNLKGSSQAQKLAQDELAILHKELGTLTCERNKAKDDLKTTVLHFERDVAESKQEVSKAEVQRLQETKDVLEKLLESLNNSLAQEQENFQTSLDSASKYSDLIRKFNTTDASADSNRVLCEEIESQKSKADEAVARQVSLEKQIQLLQEKIRKNVNRYEILLVEKKCLETEKELFKKQAQELVSLNRTEQEYFVKLQQEMSEKEKLMQSKNQEITRVNISVQQLKINQSTLINERSRAITQLNSVRDLYRKSNADLAASNAERSKLTQQLNEVRQSEELLKKEVVTVRKNFNENGNKLKELRQSLIEQLKKNEGLEKQTVQLRKIATKYKKQAGEATEEGVTVSAPLEKIKELEDNIVDLKQQLELGTEDLEKTKTDLEQIRNSSSREGDLEKQMSNKDNVIRTLKKQLDEKTKVLESLRKFKGGEEFKMTQRQLELHKQAPGTSKPATSGATADKISTAPLTTNIKPLAALAAAAVASPRLQVSAIQVVAPSKPFDTHSDAMVSSIVTLRQASTVTSTPTVSASAHLTTSTSSTATTTLMTTVSPTTAATTATASQQQFPTTSQSGEKDHCFAQASPSSSISATGQSAGQSSGESGIKHLFAEGLRVFKADDVISWSKAMASQQDPARAGMSGVKGNQKRPLESLSVVDLDKKQMRTR